MLANTHKRYKVDLPYRHRISANLTVANLDIEALGVAKMSKSSSPEPPVFVAHQLCPPHLRQLVEDTVKSFDDKWLLPPVEGERFDSGKTCLARLQGFALSQGFAVVTIASEAKRFRFTYIHYSGKTKNWRKLKQHVEKDLESGKIISKRQRDSTSKQARGCP